MMYTSDQEKCRAMGLRIHLIALSVAGCIAKRAKESQISPQIQAINLGFSLVYQHNCFLLQ